jgi:flagellar L-ring protein precursor FlgH
MNKPLSSIFERAYEWAQKNGVPADRRPGGESELERASKQSKRLSNRTRTSESQTAMFRKAGFMAFLLASLVGASADSLWKPAARSSLSDKKASAVGDIVTIVVQESATTSKQNNTKTSKSADIDASITSFLYGPTASGLLTKGGQYPALKAGSKNTFDGGGQINNSEQINARIAVRVVDVLPNNTMIVEGRRRTAFSGEKQEVVLRGVVRGDDVSAANTVLSYNVADASISIVSSGSVSDTQKKGWFTKTWDKVNPF